MQFELWMRIVSSWIDVGLRDEIKVSFRGVPVTYITSLN